ERIGWVSVGSYTGGGAHTYANDGATTYGVNHNPDHTLSGYAWSPNVGWIKFNPTDGGVSIDPATGYFSGHAWGERIGWIKFAGTAQNSTAYRVAVQNYTVTPTAGSGGTVNPSVAQTVLQNAPLQLTVTPAANYTTDNAVTGDCPAGSWNGSAYTTGAIVADCAVGFSFTANSGGGGGYVPPPADPPPVIPPVDPPVIPPITPPVNPPIIPPLIDDD
ncbi:hypothetical protein, partial [Thiospirillum jenense]